MTMVTSIADRGYAHPELLAETDWLASRLSDSRVRIVDARGAEQYAEGHIAGAVHMDGFGRSIPRTENNDMGAPGQWAATVGALGIDNDTTVVVCDVPSQRMGMVAWTFLYYGHSDIRILDGGVTKWMAEGRPLDTQVPTWPAATYTSSPTPAVYCSLEDARLGVQRDDFVFWDTRSGEEYAGTASGFRPVARPGHIPGAAHLEWTQLLDPQTRTLKSGPELRELLEAHGITPDKQVAGYCQGGARGALGGYVLRILGFDRGQAYAGSYDQWSNQSDTAVER